jgi:hypothetical protein
MILRNDFIAMSSGREVLLHVHQFATRDGAGNQNPGTRSVCHPEARRRRGISRIHSMATTTLAVIQLLMRDSSLALGMTEAGRPQSAIS